MDATRTSLPQKILLAILGVVFVFGLSPIGNYAYAAEQSDDVTAAQQADEAENVAEGG